MWEMTVRGDRLRAQKLLRELVLLWDKYGRSNRNEKNGWV